MAFMYIPKGSSIRLAKPIPTEAIDHLPAKVYAIRLDSEGPYLETMREKFDIPPKIFGNPAKYINLIVDEFRRKKMGSTGALLTGHKGTGKSLTSEAVANRLLQQGVPVFLVDSTIPVGLISDVIRNVGPVCVIFDEFAKYYPEQSDERPDQQDLLPLFSDSSLKQVLFLLSENSTGQISEFLQDRPGRIEFWFTFGAPGWPEFQEIAEGSPIHPAVMDYIKTYLSIYTGRIGTDGLFMLRDLAINAETPDVFVERIRYRNIPMAVLPRFIVERALYLPTNQLCKVDLVPFGTGAHLKLYSASFEDLGEVTILREDLQRLTAEREDRDPFDRIFFRWQNEKFKIMINFSWKDDVHRGGSVAEPLWEACWDRRFNKFDADHNAIQGDLEEFLSDTEKQKQENMNATPPIYPMAPGYPVPPSHFAPPPGPLYSEKDHNSNMAAGLARFKNRPR